MSIDGQIAAPESLSGVLLVIDTCGERGSVALFRGKDFLGEQSCPERAASATLLGAIRAALDVAGLQVRDLGAVGVVNGPGSFTGVRVGLAVGKGLCEGAGLPLATASRLAVLARAGDGCGFAVLRAGREQMYVRESHSGSEQLMDVREFLALARGSKAVYAEPEAGVMLGVAVEARLVPVSAKDAGSLLRRCLREGDSALGTADANYLRDESAIYRRAGGLSVPEDRSHQEATP